MITEILLRAYTDSGVGNLEAIQRLIENNTNMHVKLIDHRNISASDFCIEKSEKLISLDKHVAYKVGARYFRISRVFDMDGNVLCRHMEGDILERGSHIRILDTDMVKGETIKIACDTFNTSKYSVPLVLDDTQDLIDIEDLMFDTSLCRPKYAIKRCSYLVNPRFFSERTSLPIKLYDPIKEIVNVHPYLNR